MYKYYRAQTKSKTVEKSSVKWPIIMLLSVWLMLFLLDKTAYANPQSLQNAGTRFLSLDTARFVQKSKNFRIIDKRSNFKPLNRNVLRAAKTPIRSKEQREQLAARKAEREAKRALRKQKNLKKLQPLPDLASVPESMSADAAILSLFSDNIDVSHTAVRHSWPVDQKSKQRISSPYGMRDDPFTGADAFHAGVDIAAPSGTRILASANGIVESVGTHPRLGSFVKIKHRDGSVSQYGHIKHATVSKGQQVRQGNVIAHMGSTGRSTGSHLDYSLRIDGQTVDPLAVLSIPESVQRSQQRLEISSVQ